MDDGESYFCTCTVVIVKRPYFVAANIISSNLLLQKL